MGWESWNTQIWGLEVKHNKVRGGCRRRGENEKSSWSANMSFQRKNNPGVVNFSNDALSFTWKLDWDNMVWVLPFKLLRVAFPTVYMLGSLLNHILTLPHALPVINIPQETKGRASSFWILKEAKQIKQQNQP